MIGASVVLGETLEDLAGRIRIGRQADERPLVVVEGPADKRFIERIIPKTNVAVYRANSRDLAVNTIRQLVAWSLPRVACVVDRDFDDVVSAAEADGLPIAAYDNADLEAMIWNTSTFADVIYEKGSEEKLEAFGGIEALRVSITKSLEPLERLRRANALNNWGLNFDSLDVSRKAKREDLSLGVASICDHLWRPDLQLDKHLLFEAAANQTPATCPYTGEPLLRGKDALALAGVALRKLIGNLRTDAATSEVLGEALRLAVSEAEINRTRWRSVLTKWLDL